MSSKYLFITVLSFNYGLQHDFTPTLLPILRAMYHMIQGQQQGQQGRSIIRMGLIRCS